MIDTFTAIDFETAQGPRWSICQTGIVRVVKGVIAEKRSWINMPPENYYWEQFSDIHGMTAQTTVSAPSFNLVWPEIERYITGQQVVAHNSFGFDFKCIQAVLEYYALPPVQFFGHCTYKLLRNNLAALCEKYDIELNHHDALSDALACAQLFMIAQGGRLKNMANMKDQDCGE